MAFSVTGDGAFAAVQGDYYVLTTADLTITDGDANDRLRVSTLPTVGTLKKDGANMVVGSEFSVQDITDGKIVYSNDGVADTNDSFGVLGVPYDSSNVAGTPTSEDTSTITITAGTSWVLIVTPSDLFPMMVAYSAERYPLFVAGRDWLLSNRGTYSTFVSGASDVLTVTDFLTEDNLALMDKLGSYKPTPVNAKDVSFMTTRILTDIEVSGWSTVKTAVTNNGSANYLSRTIWAALSTDSQTKFKQLRANANINPNLNSFYAAMDAAKAALA